MTQSPSVPDDSDAPRRGTVVDPDIADYVSRHLSAAGDAVADELARRTREQFGEQAMMNIGHDQGVLLQMLVRISKAHSVAEIGTFTGMSALWLARGLPEGGRLTCFEVWDRPIELAREAWAQAGVADRIVVVLGPALEGLAKMPADWAVDMAFVDADKPNYRAYVEALLDRMSPHGLITVDNTLWDGAVLDPTAEDANTTAIKEFNDWLANRDDLDVVILTIGDGVTLIQRRDESTPAPVPTR